MPFLPSLVSARYCRFVRLTLVLLHLPHHTQMPVTLFPWVVDLQQPVIEQGPSELSVSSLIISIFSRRVKSEEYTSICHSRDKSLLLYFRRKD